jgi:hypothetical protein
MWDNAARRVVFICGHTTSPFAVGSRVPPSPRVLCRVYQAGFSDRHVGHSVVRPAEMDVWGTRRVSAGHAGSPRVYQAARASSIHRTEATAPKKKARFPGLFCERGTGLEPATLSLGNTRSTAWIGRLRSTMRKRTRWNPLEPARAGWSLAHASGPSRCSEPVADLVQLESNGSRRTPAACRFSRRDKERGFVVAALATRAHCLAWEQSCLDGKQVLAGPCSGLGPANLKYPVDIGSPCRPAPPEGL